ncbi:MAG: hypothetical protein Q7K38_02740 [Candidatus Wildermuthbacteria bacterium]|nr:hypothetical protein [Candidatus Wildermuthbacteria bacterium]
MAFSKIWILIAIVVLMGGGVFAWQYWQFKTVPLQSCGGDFSYNTQCPFGTYCKSLGQGPFAGGICTSYLAPLFKALPPLLSESKGEEQKTEVLDTQSSRNVVEGDSRDAVVAEELGMALKCAGVFPVLGNTMYADITGDGNEEVIVHEESCGSVGQAFKGIYTIHQDSLAQLATKEDLSSPKLVKWDDDSRELIGVNFVYETGDAHCCPSKERVTSYKWDVKEQRFMMVAEEVRGWQTYRNEEYGVEFQYPDDWYTGGGLRGDTQFLICLNPSGVSGDCTGLVTISWNVDFEERYKAIKNVFKEYTIEESTIYVAGEMGKLLKISGYPKGGEGFSREVFFENNGFVYNIAVESGRKDVFDQILSTFRFI